MRRFVSGLRALVLWGFVLNYAAAEAAVVIPTIPGISDVAAPANFAEPPLSGDDPPCDPCSEECAGGVSGGATSADSPPSPNGGSSGSAPNGDVSGQQAGDPVDIFSGRLQLRDVDLVVPGAFPIRVVRRYDSQSQYDSPLGYGWSFNYDYRLYSYTDGSFVVRTQCGIRQQYRVDVGGDIVSTEPARRRPGLAEDPNTPGGYVLTYGTGTRLYFDAAGLARTLENPQGQQLRFAYVGDPSPTKDPLAGVSMFSPDPTQLMTVAFTYRLERIEEWSATGSFTGRSVLIEYYAAPHAAAGRVESIEAGSVGGGNLRRVTYSYDEADPNDPPNTVFRGNLTAVEGLEGITQAYEYADVLDASLDPHNITSIQSGPGMAPVLVEYDANVGLDRVKEQTRGLGLKQTKWEFRYLETTEVQGKYRFRDPSSGITYGDERFAHDIDSSELGRLVVRTIAGAEEEPSGNSQWFYAFNPSGYLLEAVDPLINNFVYLREVTRPLLDAVVICGPNQAHVTPPCDLTGVCDAGTGVCKPNGDASIVKVVDYAYNIDGYLSRRVIELAARSGPPAQAKQEVVEEFFYEVPGQAWLSRTDLYSDADPNKVFRTDRRYYRRNPVPGQADLGPDDPGYSVSEPVTNLYQLRRLAKPLDELANDDSDYEITEFRYNASSRQLEAVIPPELTTPDGLELHLDYFGDGHPNAGMLEETKLATTAEPAGMSELRRSFAYDARNFLRSITDAKNHVRTIDRDNRNRITAVTQPVTTELGSVQDSVSFLYSGPNEGIADESSWPPGIFLSRVDQGGALVAPPGTARLLSTRFSYDDLGFRVMTERLDGAIWKTFSGWTRDSLGRAQERIDAIGLVTRFDYDLRGRLQSVEDVAAASLRSFEFDATGNRTLLEVTNLAGTAPAQRESFVYDALGRIGEAIQVDYSLAAVDLATQFFYDAAGNVSMVAEPESPGQRITKYGYDSLSRLRRVTFPDPSQSSIVYDYDGRGRLEKITNARSQVIEYYFLPWGGVDHIEYLAESRSVSLLYDFEGRLESVAESAGGTPTYSQGYEYDELGRVRDAKFDHFADGTKAVRFGYDLLGNRDRMRGYDCGVSCPADLTTLPVEFEQSWLYDDLGRLDETNLTGGVVGYTFESDDRLGGIAFPSGVAQVVNYELDGRLKEIRVDGLSETFLDLDYSEWDLADRLKGVEERHSAGQDPAYVYAFGYDVFGRLNSADYPVALGPPNEDFRYDGSGNRLSSPEASPETWIYDDRNRLIASPATELLCYDVDGNLESKGPGPVCSSASRDRFSWNSESRLVTYEDAAGVQTTYRYDLFGRRLSKASGASETSYLWAGDELVAEFDSAGVREVLYEYGNGFAPVSVSFGETSPTSYAVHSDHLDTPKLLTDSSGAVAWRSSYAGFGEAQLGTPQLAQPFNIRFPGQYYDAETGLHYNRYRYYDPSIGRYISADPIGQAGGVNLYTYVLNDPVNWMDPFGLDRLISPRPGGPGGPVITFNNDDPNGASPNQPVTDATAAMVESAVVNSGVSSVNINSTTGGHASNPDSRHNQKKAVDINSVNGKPVPNAGKGSDPCDPAADPVGDLQKAFAGEPNIRENFGPSRNEKTGTPGGPVTPRPDQAAGHGNHIHASGQR